MKTITYPLVSFFLISIFIIAVNPLMNHLQQPLAALPALLILFILLLIQCSSLFAAINYYNKGGVKSLLLGLIPTVITCIVNTGILLLQYFSNDAHTDFVFYFEIYLICIFIILAAGRHKHTFVLTPKKERLEMHPSNSYPNLNFDFEICLYKIIPAISPIAFNSISSNSLSRPGIYSNCRYSIVTPINVPMQRTKIP